MTNTENAACSARRLKDAFGRLLELAGGAKDVETRVSPWSLYAYANVNEAKHFAPVDVICALEKHAAEPVMTRQLAFEAGYILLPVAWSGKGDELAARLMKVGKEHADVFAQAAKSLTDNQLNPKEAERLIKEIDQAIGALSSLRILAHEAAAKSGNAFTAAYGESI